MKPIKSILITGCSSGIGLDAALTLKAQGFEVFATARKAQDVDMLREKGLNAKLLDLTDEFSMKNAVQWVLDNTGGTIDALFNNRLQGHPHIFRGFQQDYKDTHP